MTTKQQGSGPDLLWAGLSGLAILLVGAIAQAFKKAIPEPAGILDAVPDNEASPDFGLLSLLPELNARELFWWRIVGHEVNMRHPDPECMVGIRYNGEIPVLIFTQTFMALERSAAIVALKEVLARTERSCRFT